MLQPLFGDLVVCAPHDREDHALPIRWEPIFSAEERVPGAWSLEIFYGDFLAVPCSADALPLLRADLPFEPMGVDYLLDPSG